MVTVAKHEALEGGGFHGLTTPFVTNNANKIAFLQSIPGVSLATVIDLLSKYENLNAIINSSVDELVNNGVEESLATYMHTYFKYNYNEDQYHQQQQQQTSKGFTTPGGGKLPESKLTSPLKLNVGCFSK